MARTKAHHVGSVRGINGLIWIKPRHPKTETGTRFDTIPAIDATGPDGRRWIITLESEWSDGTSRASYIDRMRGLGNALIKEADRMAANPER